MQGGSYAPTPGYGLTSATTEQPTEQPSLGGQTGQRQPLQASGDRSGMSHLDSFFASSGWTREDVMVVAAGVQIAMWIALLYLEVKNG